MDTAYGQLDWNLRNDPKVIPMERTNALHVEFPEKIDLITIDVGWTKQEKILPHALTLLKEGGRIVSLLKPHYEFGRSIKPEEKELPEKILKETLLKLEEMGINVVELVRSPIKGGKGGNTEYLILVELQEA